MWWPWASQSPDGDAVRNLDPSLRKFLEKETPPERPAAPAKPQSSRADIVKQALDAQTPTQPPNLRTNMTAPSVPAQSQYQDGRYADLWKTYRSLAEIEAATQTDQDRLASLADVLHEGQRLTKEAASENCALEALAIQDCYGSGGAWSKLTLCRAENRAFDKCWEMQAKFLKALGYAGVVGRAGAEGDAERMQMHADALYRRMVKRERERKEAEEKGLPVPAAEPVMSRENIAAFMGSASGPSMRLDGLMARAMPEDRAKYGERLKGKSAEERELEMRLIESELRSQAEYGRDVAEVFVQEKRDRVRRKREGRATLGDRLKSWWGWDETEDN